MLLHTLYTRWTLTLATLRPLSLIQVFPQPLNGKDIYYSRSALPLPQHLHHPVLDTLPSLLSLLRALSLAFVIFTIDLLQLINIVTVAPSDHWPP